MLRIASVHGRKGSELMEIVQRRLMRMSPLCHTQTTENGYWKSVDRNRADFFKIYKGLDTYLDVDGPAAPRL